MPQSLVDWNSPKISELLVHLDEIIREDRSRPPAYRFIDFGGVVGQLTSKTNHVVFGRRGAGKSVLLRELEKRVAGAKTKTILVDIESIAQKSYPNLIIEILLIIFRDLLTQVETGFFSKLIKGDLAKRIRSAINQLETLRRRADTSKHIVSDQTQKTLGREFGEELTIITNILKLAAKVSDSKAVVSEEKFEETFDKIRVLFNNIGDYRKLIGESLRNVKIETLYILVDDFYQIDSLHQPLVADYLKRLFRGIPCYLKIATARNRSLLFVKDDLSEAGLQAEQDYRSVDLDLSLDDFQRAKDFLSAVLQNIFEQKLSPLTPDALFDFSGTSGLTTLTEASGGNPRDFINILRVAVYAKKLSGTRTPITYQDICSAAISYHKTLVRDTERSYANFEILDTLLGEVIVVCQNNSDIGFYVTRKDTRDYPAIHSLIGQLVDCRFLHILTHTYNAPMQEGIATVYILPMAIYTEFLPNTSLADRRMSQKSYTGLALNEISKKFPELSLELELMGKAAN